MEPKAEENWQTNRAPLPPRGEGYENHARLYDTFTAPPPLGRLNAPTRLRRGRVQFVNRRGTGSFQLFPLSPCLDKGIMRSWMTDAVDLDGRARVFRSRVDMGCYESHYMAGTMVVVW